MKLLKPELIVPTRDKLQVADIPQILSLLPGRITEMGRELFGKFNDLEYFEWRAKHPLIAGASGTFSNYSETSILAHLAGKTAWTMPASVNLCLQTVLPDSSKTINALPSNGATTSVTEATYTGYTRINISGAGWNTAVSGGAGGASSISNSGTLTGGACTSGSSTIIGWCLADAVSTSGNMLAWGSATSTVISTTQTPPTVAAGGLVLQLT